jgi:RNA polymerase sigma-70 factor (ECF subfamily)
MGVETTNFSRAAVYLVQDADDSQLVERCLAGDTAAFEPLVLRYQRPFYTIALRMLGCADEASDAVQNAFLKAYQNLALFDGRRRFFSWAYRILVNECLNAQRARPSEPLVDEPLVLDDPLDALAADERKQQVQRAVAALPHDYREVVVLRYFAELSYEEISDAIGVPVKTVKSRLYTARQRLTATLFDGGART